MFVLQTLETTESKWLNVYLRRAAHLKHMTNFCIPVEAEAVEALLAWLVDRVESGAGILLLSAIWKSDTKKKMIYPLEVNN